MLFRRLLLRLCSLFHLGLADRHSCHYFSGRGLLDLLCNILARCKSLARKHRHHIVHARRLELLPNLEFACESCRF